MTVSEILKTESGGQFRWWKKTPGKLTKLAEAYKMGCTDKEACFYAGISDRQLYYFQKKFPSFVSKKKEWRLNPSIKARMTLFKGLSDPKIAKWFLERHHQTREEFCSNDTTPTATHNTINFGQEASNRMKKYVDK